MNFIIKYLKRLVCRHPEYATCYTEYAKHKWVNFQGKKKFKPKLRYDIYRQDICGCCGKKLTRGIVKRNLTEWQMLKRFGESK